MKGVRIFLFYTMINQSIFKLCTFSLNFIITENPVYDTALIAPYK